MGRATVHFTGQKSSNFPPRLEAQRILMTRLGVSSDDDDDDDDDDDRSI